MDLIVMSSYIRLPVYLWALFELGLLGNLYYFAYRKSHESKIMFWAFLLYSSLAVFFLYLVAIAYTVNFSFRAYSILVSLMFIPVGIVAFVARVLRHKSIGDGLEMEKVKGKKD